MFFILSKLLGFFCGPFYWILLAFAIAWFTKRPGLKKWSFRTGVAMTLIFTNTFIFCEFARLWEPDGTTIEEVGHYDVAVVLGGMAEYDNSHHRLSLRRGGDRLWQAIHLYHLGKVDRILIAGANGDITDRGLNEALQFRDVLMDEGIPYEDILVDSVSQNTYQNAVESKKIIDAHPEIKSMLLVTSALHMPRAEACFVKAGFSDFGTFTTDHFTGKERGYHFEQLIVPNESNLTDWSKLLHEVAGYIIYDMMGYI